MRISDVSDTADPTNRADLVLVVPVGLDRAIFPWGVHLLRDYLLSGSPPGDVAIWRLDREPFLEALFDRYRCLLANIFKLLKMDAQSVFFGHTFNPYLFLAVVAGLGPRFIEIGKRRKLIRINGRTAATNRSLHEQLVQLQCSYEQSLVERALAFLKQHFGERDEARKIWAISVYDYAAFSSLHLCRILRWRLGGDLFILGGDYFDSVLARKLVEESVIADAVVVGHGEEVMRQVMGAVAEGRSLASLRVPGLSCRETDFLQVATIPPNYKTLGSAPEGSFVHRTQDGTIHVLAQRGCSWGRCTFCSQIDRDSFFQVNPSHIGRGLETAMEAAPPGPQSTRFQRVRLDADDNAPEAVASILSAARRGRSENGRVLVEHWMMVQRFGTDFARVLLEAHPAILVNVMLNIESLNTRTLKIMRKGHSSLQALEAVKAIQDCGHIVESNYFLSFPGETIQSVREEVELLERAVHLLLPPKAIMCGFPYAANCRDLIFRQQRRFAIRVRRHSEDVWLNEAYSVDLPFSIWSFGWEGLDAWPIDRLIERIYQRMWAAKRSMMLARIGGAILSDNPSDQAPCSIADLHRFLVYQAMRFTHVWMGRLIKETALARRMRIVDYIESIMRSYKTKGCEKPRNKGRFSTWWQKWRSDQEEVRASYLFILGQELTKDYHLPGASQSLKLRLAEKELRVLRFLYWRRTREAVNEHFRSEVSIREIDAIITRHERLGSVVANGRWLLCVANDPGYWGRD